MAARTTPSKISIVIVGAGISGLQAAHTLLKHPAAKSFDVTVLEASDRIGGRVHTESPWGFPLDYGASYVHGTEENPLTPIAKAVGATFIPRKSSDLRIYFDDDGVAAAATDARLIYKKVADYSDAALQFSREHDVHRDTTVGSFFDDCIKEDLDLKTSTIRRMVSNGVEMLSHSAGCDLNKLSLKFYWTDDDLPGDRAFVDSSYEQIVQYIARPALAQNIIKFKRQIQSIDVSSCSDKPITLQSSTNETFNAHAVIVTVPLGSLKRNAIHFSPALPLRVQNAISNLGYGILERLFIRFSHPWWLSPFDNPTTIGVEFFRFPSLKSTMHCLPRGTLNFFSLARIHNPQSVLGVFVSADLAKFLTSIPKDDLKAILETFYIPHLPNYDADNPNCRILEVDCSSWCHNEFSGFGSYTHIPVGSECGDEDMMTLSAKILDAGKGGVWFAGEHTTKTEIIEGLKYTAMATVTGAYQSGSRAALDVLYSFL